MIVVVRPCGTQWGVFEYKNRFEIFLHDLEEYGLWRAISNWFLSTCPITRDKYVWTCDEFLEEVNA